MAPTAYLSDAVTLPQLKGNILIGIVRGDTQGRFKDGDRIRTSYVKKRHPEDLFETRSGNFYKVESWA